MPISIFVSFSLWGFADSSLHATLYAITMSKSMFGEKNTSSAFAVFQLFHALATGFEFVASTILGEWFWVYQVWLMMMLTFGALCVGVLGCFVAHFDAKEKKKKESGKKEEVKVDRLLFSEKATSSTAVSP